MADVKKVYDDLIIMNRAVPLLNLRKFSNDSINLMKLLVSILYFVVVASNYRADFTVCFRLKRTSLCAYFR